MCSVGESFHVEDLEKIDYGGQKSERLFPKCGYRDAEK